MSINLRAFRQLTNGFARNHHFSIGIADWRTDFFNNKLLGMLAGIASSPIQNMFCSATSLPSKKIQHTRVPVQHGIPGIEIASDVVYAPWTVTFYADEILMLRYFFLKWMEGVNNTKVHSFNRPTEYKSTLAYAAVLTPQDVPCHVYSFYGLFPVDIGDIIVQQIDTNVMTFNVTFAYDYFKVNEPIGYGLALAQELVSDKLNGTSNTKKRTVNAPLGVKVKLPF